MSDETLKCGRVTYTLSDGDTVLDNGYCTQFISRRVGAGFNSYPPRVSKAAFNGFKKLDGVVKRNVGAGLIEWVYFKNKDR